MERNIITPAIVLSGFRVGEKHKSVRLLTPQRGILSALAHGAYSGKGKLGGATQAFTQGEFYLYINPVKNSAKITDVNVEADGDSLRNDLDTVYFLSLCAEIVIQTYPGEDGGSSVYSLFSNLLRSLPEKRSFKEVETALMVFIWKYLIIAGLAPDLGECSECGRGLEKEEPVLIDPVSGQACCERCSSANAMLIPAGGRAFLDFCSANSVARSIKIGFPDESRRSVKGFLLRYIQEIAEWPLKTLRFPSELFQVQ